MELPNIGKQCGLSSCKQLDFLPFTCNLCHKIFCRDHQSYTDHDCPHAHMKDVRVPVCPMCNEPIPVSRGEDPNFKVNEHINKNCELTVKKKKSSNACSASGCKQKELVPVRCASCAQNYCLRHRFEQDHDCAGQRAKLAQAATRRVQPSSTSRQPASAAQSSATRSSATKAKPSPRPPQQSLLNQTGIELNRARQERQRQQQPVRAATSSASTGGSSQSARNAGLSEDEALAMAMQASLSDVPQGTAQKATPPPTAQQAPAQPAEDEELQRAIAASLQEQQKPAQESNCTIS